MRRYPVMPGITPASLESIMPGLSGAGQGVLGNIASGVWPSANLAIYIPFFLVEPVSIAQLFLYNGSAVSGNVDVGLYAEDGTRLVSTGSTAQAGTSMLQFFDVTDTWLGPGVFYLASALDNTTGTTQRVAPSNVMVLSVQGVAQQASAFPLPAAATFAALTFSYLPYVGLARRTL
jgi:hypothetical protein